MLRGMVPSLICLCVCVYICESSVELLLLFYRPVVQPFSFYSVLHVLTKDTPPFRAEAQGI